MIKELIVVEGKNDAHAVRRALGDVDILWTEGFGLNAAKLSIIKTAALNQGVIVFTDPDTVGEQIRERIRKHVPEAKHVYLSKRDARCEGDIGVENASPEIIQKAFAHIQQEEKRSGVIQVKFTIEDMWEAGLVGYPDSAHKRIAIGRKLGIGDANAKQFLNRLNRFGIAREALQKALEEM